MISDPTVVLTCDKCGGTTTVEPEWAYRTMSEHAGFYDCDDMAIRNLAADDGWKFIDGKDLCEGCVEEEGDDEEN